MLRLPVHQRPGRDIDPAISRQRSVEEVDGEFCRLNRQVLREDGQVDDAEKIIEGKAVQRFIIRRIEKRQFFRFCPGTNPRLMAQNTGNLTACAPELLGALNKEGSLTNE